MKLRFEKNEQSEISVFLESDGNKRSFDYVSMIKGLITSRHLESPAIEGDFTDAEIASIRSMAEYLNRTLASDEEE